MDIVFALLPAALGLALLAVVAYIWAAKSGQFDDLETPARRMLIDDKPLPRKPEARAMDQIEKNETPRL